jgi:hypothetical protein
MSKPQTFQQAAQEVVDNFNLLWKEIVKEVNKFNNKSWFKKRNRE